MAEMLSLTAMRRGKLSIAVVGAGIGGLAVAATLRHASASMCASMSRHRALRASAPASR